MIITQPCDNQHQNHGFRYSGSRVYNLIIHDSNCRGSIPHFVSFWYLHNDYYFFPGFILPNNIADGFLSEKSISAHPLTAERIELVRNQLRAQSSTRRKKLGRWTRMIYELLVVALEALISQYISLTCFPMFSTQRVSWFAERPSSRLEFPTRPLVLTDVIISIEFKC